MNICGRVNMNNCDCKHASICNADPDKCTLAAESKVRSPDVIPGYSSRKISAMQGRPENDLAR